MSALRNHVLNVVIVGAQEQVSRVHADRVVAGVTGALIDTGGWQYIGREDFPCPDCGCRDGNHSVSDCGLWRIYDDYRGQAQTGREDVHD